MDILLNAVAITILVWSVVEFIIWFARRIKPGNGLSAEEEERLMREAFGGHEDVWIDIDGKPQRVFGDPNMSEETKQALAVMIKAATEAVARGDFDDDETEKESK